MNFNQKGRPTKIRGFVIKAVAVIIFKFLRKQWQSKKSKKQCKLQMEPHIIFGKYRRS